MPESLRWRIPAVLATIVLAALVLMFGGRPGKVTDLWSRLKLGFDLKGGVELRYKVQEALTPEQEKNLTPEERAQARGKVGAKVSETVDIIRKRLDPDGSLQPDIRGESGGIVTIRLQGLTQSEVSRIKKLVTDMGQLEFRAVVPQSEYDKLTPEDREARKIEHLTYVQVASSGQRIEEKLWIQRKDQYNLTGADISRAFPTTDNAGLRPAVGFQLTPAGGNKFAKMTRDLAMKGTADEPSRLAILLNDVVQSAPTVKFEIAGGSAIIEGADFTQAEVLDMVTIIKAGSLPTKLVYESETYIGPAMGSDSLARGKNAIVISMVAVLVFMAGYYLLSGFIADFAVVINVIFILAIIMLSDSFPGAGGVGGIVLTLPGIAGIVLTAGMAVDANVLIYERIREERARGKVLRFAVKNGYERAFWTIFDSNLTTLITGIVLWIFLTGPVRSFAVTLCVGISVSMFTALFITRVVFDLLIGAGVVKDLRMFQLFGNSKIGFVKRAPVCITISIVAIVVGMAAFIWRGGQNLGIEFTSGIAAQLDLTKTMSIDDVRKRVYDLGYDNAQVVTAFREATAVGTGKSTQFIIRIPEKSVGQTQQQREEILDRIETAFAEWVPKQPVKVTVEEATPITAQDDAYRGGTQVTLSFWAESEVKASVNMPAVSAAAQIAPEGTEAVEHAQTETPPAPTAPEAPQRKLEPVSLKPSVIEAGLKSVGIDDAQLMVDPARTFYSTIAFKTHQTDIEKMEQEVTKPGLLSLPEAYAYKQFVGPAQAHKLILGAVAAVLASMACIVVYVGFRFGNVRYGLAAIAALAHDVLITLGAVAVGSLIAGTAIGDFLQIQSIEVDLNVIAALLTIVGYSINDTIVVFDRIRENLGRRKEVTGEIIDLSVNQTLSRTVITSFTTLTVCMVLYLAGGRQLHGLAFCLTIGVIVGTYSSIFIASPLLVVTHAVAKEAGGSGRSRENAVSGKSS